MEEIKIDGIPIEEYGAPNSRSAYSKQIGGRSNGKSLESSITFLKYIDELESNKLYGIKKCGNITLLTKSECVPVSIIEKKIEELGGMEEIGDIPREMYNRIEYAIEILLEILEESKKR